MFQVLPESLIQFNIDWYQQFMYSFIMLSSRHAFSVFQYLIDFNIYFDIGGINKMKFCIEEIVIMFSVIRYFIQFELIKIFGCFLRQPSFNIFQYSLLLFDLNCYMFCLISFLWLTILASSTFFRLCFLPSSSQILRILFYVFSLNFYNFF